MRDEWRERLVFFCLIFENEYICDKLRTTKSGDHRKELTLMVLVKCFTLLSVHFLLE